MNAVCLCTRLRSEPAAGDGLGTERGRVSALTLQRFFRAERRLDRFGRGRNKKGNAPDLDALLAGAGRGDGDVYSIRRNAASGAGIQLSMAPREGAPAGEL